MAAKKLQSNHIHRLKLHEYKSGTKVFFCTLPDCHFKIDRHLALGKRALCNLCGEEFLMNEFTIKLVKPHCPNCGKVRIKDSDGKNRFVRKISNRAIVLREDTIQEADNSLFDLRSRLNNITEDELEKDI